MEGRNTQVAGLQGNAGTGKSLNGLRVMFNIDFRHHNKQGNYKILLGDFWFGSVAYYRELRLVQGLSEPKVLGSSRQDWEYFNESNY